MKSKLTMMVAAAMACAAIQLTAMPTEEEARKAVPVVKKMLAQERAALESGKKTRSEVAAAAMTLASEADTDAAKLILMKGAFTLYVKDGNLEKAVETMNALEAAIADMPPQSVTNMIEAALLGVSKKEDHTRLYKLLDDNKADLSSHVESKLVVSSVEERSSIASILKGMIKVPGRDYWLSMTELTQGQWESVMGYNLSRHKGKNLPVENVSRDDCDVFLEKLNQTKEVKASQFEFRLPELEEWKYAAWAGSAGIGSWIKPGVVGDVLDMSWVESNSSNQTHAVATKAPNAFGFYDMLGNVWEWLSGDAPGGGKGALKGCAFNQAADKCTWNANCYIRKTERNCSCGLRLAAHLRSTMRERQREELLQIQEELRRQREARRVDASAQGMSVAAKKLLICDFLLNKDFKRNAKFYLCLFSASWCGPCRAEMPRIAKTYAETLKNDPNIELIHFSRDQNDEKALAWAKEHDVKFPVVKPNGGNPLDLRARGIPHLFIVKADGTLIEEGHPMKLFTDEKLRELKTANGGGEAKNMAKMTSSGKETIDGVEWAYSIVDGKAQLDRVVSSNVTGLITIPSALGGCPVTSIGRNELRSGFGWRVFEKCCNMSSVAIPSGVMNIGDSAFFGCSNMVSVTIPSSVTNIARCAFSNCGRLTSFAVDEENTKYSSRNELLCSNDGTTLVEGVNGDVSIPTCVKNIKDDAFKGRTGLKSVMVPSSVTSIGSSAFSDCRGLSSVAIPASVKKIGRYAFWNCSGLKSFSVDSDNPSYSARDGMLCSKDGSTLFCGVNGDVTIPSCVQNIADGAFSGCTGLTSVTIPDSVTCIAHNAFRGCDSLTSVMISPRVTSIGTYAFLRCKKLVSVTIPSSVAKIGGSAFSGCDKLMSFTVDPDNPSYSSHNGMLCSKDGLTLVAGVNGDVTIPSCVQNIADDAFSGCTGLTSVTISNSVKSIGTYAFSRCESLKSVTIPNSVTNIGERAFEGCSGLTGVTIPNSVKSIGTYAFSGCKSLKSVTIPDGVTSIVNAAFSGCESLTSVTIPSSVTSIGDYAFYYCSGLTNVVIGSGVTSIGIGAFYECSALKTVTVPSRVTSIGRLAFGKTQFYDNMSDGMVILGDGVLYQYKGECPSAVTIPSNVTRIGERAFRGCSGLETMTIPSAVTDIDGRAFVDCPNLKSVHVVRDGKIEAMSFEDFFKRWKNVVAQRLNKCDFLLNGQFKKDAKVYLCLFSASWCPPCRREMPRIAKTYAESLKDDPNIELIHFSRDQNDEKALAWAKEHDVKFPVVKPNGGNPLDLRTRGIPHLFIVNADGTLVEEGHPMKLFTDEKLRELKSEQVVSGMTYTDNGGLTWSYAENDDGRIKITGVKMRSSSPITIPTLLNGRHVTRIGKDAFRGNAMITGVTIPGSIVGIEDFAFCGCPNLADLTILDGVTRIDGLDAFRYCKALRTITFPKSLKYIRNRALRDCPNVVRLNVASIEDWLSIRFVTPTSNPMCMSGASLYVNGKKITGEVVIPNGVRQINNYAFMGCNGMLSVIIPSSVESIGQSAFMYNERAKGDGGVRQVIRISSDIGTIRVGPLICDKDTSVEIMTRSECSFVGWEDDKGNLVEDPFHSNQWNTVKPRWKTKEAFPLNAAPGDITEIDLGNVPPLQFVYCPAGKFSMGYKEQPALSKVKDIEISSLFWVSKTPLRVDQLASLGLNSITDTRIGAAGIDDVSIVIQKLPSVLKERFGKMLPPGYVFRLPTEAEFEYLQKAETKDKNAQTNIWGVERLYSGGIIALLDRAPAYGRGVDVVNDVSNGTVWTVLAKVNYENQPDKDPVGWSDDPNWSVFRRRLARDCKEGKLITNQRTNKLYGFYFVVAPDVDKLNKFYWK